MASVTAPVAQSSPDTARVRVQHPLDRLRACIRLYVGIEGSLLLGLYLALWFWLGLLLDYGVFKAFMLDWVQELPWGLRALMLCALVAGLFLVVALQVVYRLARQFRDNALALVLERRYAALLGDRLITAVELADLSVAQRYGYSQPMIERTIMDAAERVQSLSLRDVFNWRRLVVMGSIVLGIGLVPYLLTAATAPLLGRSVSRQLSDFRNVASLWFERNILLANVAWPRRAYLELIDFPEHELRVGRESPRPILRVRALRWVIADSTAPEGWRALRWHELNRPNLLGPDVALDVLPAAWYAELVRSSGMVDEPRLDEFLAQLLPTIAPSGDPLRLGAELVNRGVLSSVQSEALAAAWSVDQVELQLHADIDRPHNQKQLRPGATDAIENIIHQLHEVAQEPGSSRWLRVLQVPEQVILDYRGDTLQERPALALQAGNNYSFDFAGLKESVRFTVRGEDYVTRPRLLTLVPPPQLLRLARSEHRPAYLMRRPSANEELSQLRGQTMLVADLPALLVTGEASRVDEVPIGTLLELTAEADKELTRVRLVPTPRSQARNKPGTADPLKAQAALLDGIALDLLPPRGFRARLTVQTALDFLFEFTDTDGVVGHRRVVITPKKDTPPEVKVRVEVLRRMPTGEFLITPIAMVPFSGEIRDDHGLEQIEYAYHFRQVDSPTSTKVRAAVASVGSIRWLAGPLSADLFSIAFAGLTQVDRTNIQVGGAFPLSTWVRRRQASNQFLPEHILELEVARELRETSPDFECFDLERVIPGLRGSSTQEGPGPAHYQLVVSMAASDDNADSGPFRRESERFSFRVISENELLVEIGREEELLHDQLRKAVDDLKEMQVKDVEEIIRDLPDLKPNTQGIMGARVKAVEDTVIKAGDRAAKVLTDYRRILAEMKANRVDKRMTEKVDDRICKPLGQVIDPVQGDVELTRDVLAEVRGTIEAGAQPEANRLQLTRQRLAQLIDRLDRVLENMGEITNINKVIAAIVEITKAEQKEYERLKRLQDKLELELIQGVIEGK